MTAHLEPLTLRAIAQLRRATAFAEDRYTCSGRPNRRRKPVTIRDYSKPSQLGGALMAEYWIVTDRRYWKHRTLAAAETYRAEEMQGSTTRLRVIRCKSGLKPSNQFPAIVRMLKLLVLEGLTDENRKCAEALLKEISGRHSDDSEVLEALK